MIYRSSGTWVNPAWRSVIASQSDDFPARGTPQMSANLGMVSPDAVGREDLHYGALDHDDGVLALPAASIAFASTRWGSPVSMRER